MKTTSEEETKVEQGPKPEIGSARYREWRTLATVLLCLLGLSAPVRNACSDTVTATNSNPIAIPGSGTSGTASPYPSTIGFGGFAGTITAVRITLHNFSHTFPDDCDILLVGPGWAKHDLDVGLRFKRRREQRDHYIRRCGDTHARWRSNHHRHLSSQ